MLTQIKTRFNKAIDNYFVLVTTQRNLELFTVAYRYMVQVCEAYFTFNYRGLVEV